MSQPNVETARRLCDAWNRDDWQLIESLTLPDAEGQGPEGWPEADDAHGWPELKRQLQRVKEPWAEDHYDVESVRATGDDLVLVYGRWTARGGASGVELDVDLWVLYQFRDGKVARSEFYLDGDQARQAAGL